MGSRQSLAGKTNFPTRPDPTRWYAHYPRLTVTVCLLFNLEKPGMLSLALVLGLGLSLRTKLQSLVLALALNLQSLVLSLALSLESLVLALALKV